MWKASSWLVSAKGQLFLLMALLQMRVKAMDGPNSWGPPPSHLMVVSCRMSMFPNMLHFCSKEVSKDLRGLFSIPFLEEHPSLLTKKFNRILLRN